MVAFTSSSTVNKSGKKFAPKAPPRRPAPIPKNVVDASQTSVDNRKPSTTPAPTTNAPPAPSAPDTRPSAVNAQQEQQRTEESSIADADHNIAVAPGLAPSVLSTTTPTDREHQDVSGVPDKSLSTVQPAPEVSHATAHPEPTELPHALDKLGESSLPSGNNTVQTTTTTTTTQANQSTIPSGVSETVTHETSAFEHPPSRPIQNPTATTIHTTNDVNQTGVLIGSNTNESRATVSTGNNSVESTSAQFKKPPLPKKKRRRNTAADSTTDEEGTKTRKPRGKRKREPTPEESENIEIAPAVVRMSELCKDLRTGKKSKREVELRNLELAEAERKEKAKEKGRNSSTPVKADVENFNGETSSMPSTSQTGPRMRIVNGEIVIDNASLQLDQRAEAAREIGEMENIVESRLNRKINQATYGKRTKAESWDEDLTDLFYRGLRMFGTDFSLISNMFPGRSRRQIKLKFNNEERRDPERIKQTLLGPRESVDIKTYSELTNTVYDDLEVIQKELEDDKRRIEEQHAKERLAHDEQMRNPGGASNNTNVIQSVENVPFKKRNSFAKSH
ncbi:hypothetical protein UA08_07937 [Talaromyces atroroseus]|uniref:Myb-like domain-containing protein n=1 Tax=Talaromyces atroroseus TaxID=1441469 RepID=A0A225AD23_TALAT|nr:hypothetical protein UA08_07937 [Talaromyces atroroseus]OKL56833.1 hypothetical protein UA08_07937 [Talaromyces atroroseus]